MDEILAEENVDNGADETVQWTLTDHLNTVRDIAKYDPGSDMTTVVNHLIYDAFGRVTSESDPATGVVLFFDKCSFLVNNSLFVFTGRPFDSDTQLQNNLNRSYDAHVGRWLSEDPVGFAGGDENLYRYVGNVPTDTSDPLGLVECPGGEWLWGGTMRGGQVILGYYYYKAKFTCKQSLVVGETCYRCPGQVSFTKKRYKVPVAHGSSSVLALGAGLDSTLYAYAAGTVSAPSSEQLAGWSVSGGVSVTAIAIGGTLSGGFGHTEESAGLDIGFGFSVSAFPAYTRIWSSGYELFDEPLSPQELKYLSLSSCQKEYKAIQPFVEATPSSFHYMIEY